MSSDMEGKMQSVYDQPHPDERLRREGGPAFPVSIPGCGDNGQHGMTLRDWFAGQALVGLMARDPRNFIHTTGDYAKAAYDTADAMLWQRGSEREGEAPTSLVPPDWANGRAHGYATTYARLYSRTGGENAVVVEVEDGIIITLSDDGMECRWVEPDLERAFHRPRWTIAPDKVPGRRE